MARFEYGVILLAIAALSFQLGTSFGSAAPAPVTELMPVPDTGRLAALERRIDELATVRSSAVAIPASTAPLQREVVESSSPTLTDTLAALRDAVLALGRSQGRGLPAMNPPRAANLAAVQTILASTATNGLIENSDLLMLTLPQVLERLGRPTLVNFCAEHITLQFACGDSKLFVWVKDALVVQVCMEHGA